MKPFCFGLPSFFFEDAPACKTCAVSGECQDRAAATALSYVSHVRIDDVIHRLRKRGAKPLWSAPVDVTCSSVERQTSPERVKVTLTGADQALIDKLPVKVAKKARLLMQRNQDHDARVALREGRNPFPMDGAKYLHVACDLLIAGGFTRSELRAAYMQRCDWSEGTAFSHVSAVVSLFPALRFAVEQDGRFRVTTQ